MNLTTAARTTTNWPFVRIWATFLVAMALLIGPLSMFIFGMVSFSGLFVLWVKSSKGGLREGLFVVNGVMLLLCVIWFALNVVLEVTGSGAGQAWLFSVAFLFPPLISHMFYLESTKTSGPRLGAKILISLLYAFGASASLAVVALLLFRGLEDESVLWVLGWLMGSMFVLFVFSGLLSSYFLSRYAPAGVKKAGLSQQRRTNIVLLLSMVLVFVIVIVAGTGRMIGVTNLLTIVSRSLPLFFLFFNTYYESRFEFYDVFVKRATFFFLVLAVLYGYFSLIHVPLSGLEVESSLAPWIFAIAILPIAMALPWGYRRLEELFDRVWLGRTYSPTEAVTFFLEGVQHCTTLSELLAEAERRLGRIFQAKTRVLIDDERDWELDFPAAQTVELRLRDGVTGQVILGSRPSEMPYFAGDMALLGALVEVLSYLLQNVTLQQRKQEQEKREQELVLDASRSELKALRAQINPHFLFNALNAIATLTHRDPDRAEETVEQLAEVFRYTLRRSEEEWVRVEDEVEFIRSYLQVEKARFGDRLTVQIEVDPEVEGYLVPTMMVQTLVENAVKHGVSVVKEGAVIRISARATGDSLLIDVMDNGPGVSPRSSTSRESGSARYGLVNIQTRLEGYYGERGSFELLRDENRFTIARIRIPMSARDWVAS
ncbi:MAG: histidine kinase [Acidobacteriota bacterium]|nr:MAG: histidine kinase [Acidobacteriota bacterium]